MKTVSEMKVLLAEKKLNESFGSVYTEDAFDAQYSRFLNVLESFEKRFSADREISLFSAPGRTEICGNHTDHNHGLVLAASISLDAIAVASKNDDNIIIVNIAI